VTSCHCAVQSELSYGSLFDMTRSLVVLVLEALQPVVLVAVHVHAAVDVSFVTSNVVYRILVVAAVSAIE